MNQAVLQLHDLVKTFKKNGEEVHAVKSIDISINSGEMVCFLGPSGCGKTTTLRMVAGFETPTSGMITINGNDVTNIPVNKRGIGFVFQNYALFPHLSVANNIAYGLRTQHMDETMIKQKITSSLKLVGLPDIGERYPSELSGGEQQRVALARVIVMEPSLLLMDEPLSNLDAKLRIHMRTEIRHLQKKLGITCLYVTHDQSEALTVADKIVVMSKGEVEQMGTPFEIYHSPKTSFVADFIGQANIIPSTVISSNTQNITAKIFHRHTVTGRRGFGFPQNLKDGSNALLVIRPESIGVGSASSGKGISATVKSAVFLGSHIDYELSVENDDHIINASVDCTPQTTVFRENESVYMFWNPDAALFLAR
jgi:iron(III) transport system ATP-binding protein